MLEKTGFKPVQEAKIEYHEADFSVIVPGSHVRCAVTGEAIAIDDLKYWSFARQEPYRDAHASLEAERNAAGKD